MPLFGRSVRPVYTALSPEAADECAVLHDACFARGWSALEFERLIGSRACFGDAARDSRTGAFAGFVLSRAAAGEAEILTIAVAAEWRRRGLGRELIRRHLQRLAAERVEALFLEVSEDNAAARALT